MSRSTFARVVATVVSLASLACSGASPVQPTPSVESSGAAGAVAAQAAAGTYELSFLTSQGQPVSSLPVGQELVLKAHVEDSAGVPAQGGSATFEVCSRKGGRSLARMDPAPFTECDGGSACWIHLTTFKVDAGTCPGLGPGNACVNFGFISTPRVVGFRFRFSGQRSGIANGTSASLNFTWT